MGKSDLLIFEEYLNVLQDVSEFKSVAFLGFSRENQLTEKIKCKIRHFYDMSLDNWDINSDWLLPEKYDLIICTRCAYFSKNPHVFIEKCKSSLTSNGSALIDWGLGDHWRFSNYKVGWVKNGEHEHAYRQDNYLYSCFWTSELKNDAEVQNFWKHVIKGGLGYHLDDDIEDIIKKEVPSLVSYNCKKIYTKFLWAERPQLYIITLIGNEK